LAPYSEQQAGSLDINAALARQYQQALDAQQAKGGGEGASAAQQAQVEVDASLANAKRMTERAQDFYVSLGMPKLPDSYWAKTQFVKPRDRDVVCHASAWDMNMSGDVRTKMCIKPNEEDFTTIYHELGHVYYYLAYNKQPPLFQTGAHDGF
ncbi:M2 family metallopeptidase, partial [Staphylococcus pseudintermedius]